MSLKGSFEKLFGVSSLELYQTLSPFSCFCNSAIKNNFGRMTKVGWAFEIWVFFASFMVVIDGGAEVFHQTRDRKLVEDFVIDNKDPIVHLEGTKQIIEYYKYSCELHTATSRDGYKLTLHRIPEGIHGSSKRCKVREPVVLHHGIVSSSSDWLMQDVDKNLPFILAENCFDVWLVNARGTKYSIGHDTFNSENDTRYWDFSFDEMGMYDVPAIIDYVLENAGSPGKRFKKLNWIGHSLGTTIIYVCMHYNPEYNGKIRKMVALSPVAYTGNLYSPGVRVVAQMPDPLLELIFNLLFKGRLFPEVMNTLIHAVSPKLCPYKLTTNVFCANLLYAIAGFNPARQHDAKVVSRVGAHTPQSTSVRTFTHILQGVRSGKFETQKKYLASLDPILGPVLQPVYGTLPNLDTLLNPLIKPVVSSRSGFQYPNPGYESRLFGLPSLPSLPSLPNIPGLPIPGIPWNKPLPSFPNPMYPNPFPNPLDRLPTEGGPFRNPGYSSPVQNPLNFFPAIPYNLSRTVMPMLLLFAKEDSLVHPADVLQTAKELGTPPADKKMLMFLQSTHLDLLYAKDSKDRIFERIRDYLSMGQPK